MDDAGFLHAKIYLARLNFFDDLAKVKGHRAQFGIGHKTTRPQDLSNFAHSPHHVRSCHSLVEFKPSTFNLGDKIIAAGIICTRVACLLFLLTLGEGQDSY